MSSKGSVLDEGSERYFYRKNIYELSVSEFMINDLFSPKFKNFEVFLEFLRFSRVIKIENIYFSTQTQPLIDQFLPNFDNSVIRAVSVVMIFGHKVSNSTIKPISYGPYIIKLKAGFILAQIQPQVYYAQFPSLQGYIFTI